MDNDTVQTTLNAAKIVAASVESYLTARFHGFSDLASSILQTGLATGFLMLVINQSPKEPTEEERHVLQALDMSCRGLADSLQELLAKWEPPDRTHRTGGPGQ